MAIDTEVASVDTEGADETDARRVRVRIVYVRERLKELRSERERLLEEKEVLSRRISD